MSNRLLIINELGELKMNLHKLASSKDTQTLQQILATFHTQKTVDVGHAGTGMRFLTAFFSVCEGERTLTGSDRMKERPIKELVDCLRKLGADITYIEKEGFPPLLVKGKKLSGGKINMNGGISSQYISALLMIAPALNENLEIEFEGELVSRPYIEMTIQLMKEFGAEIYWTEKGINCSNKPYSSDKKEYTVEGDWSSASYLYSMLAVSQSGSLQIEGLRAGSLQADAICEKLFVKFGIESSFQKDGSLVLHKQGKSTILDFEYNFSDCPDIAQTLAVVVAGSNVSGKLSGLKTLKIKETDRILALNSELQKVGIDTEVTADSIRIKNSGVTKIPVSPVKTYDDHRMALAFAPFALVMDYIDIEDPDVIVKSYPEYWEHLKQLGFIIEPLFSS